MTVSVGFTAEEIREIVHEYEVQAHGTRRAWLTSRGISYDRFRRWRSAVYEGDLDRRLVPREGSVVTIPPSRRTALEKQRAKERAVQEAEIARLTARVRELEASNEALGKAIGLLHEMSAHEPGENPATSAPSDSSMPSENSSQS